jgi:hypothetical protein
VIFKTSNLSIPRIVGIQSCCVGGQREFDRGLAAELVPKAALDLPLFRRGALGPLGNAVPLAHTFRREQVLYQRANSGEDSTADERGDDLTDDGTQ